MPISEAMRRNFWLLLSCLALSPSRAGESKRSIFDPLPSDADRCRVVAAMVTQRQARLTKNLYDLESRPVILDPRQKIPLIESPEHAELWQEMRKALSLDNLKANDELPMRPVVHFLEFHAPSATAKRYLWEKYAEFLTTLTKSGWSARPFVGTDGARIYQGDRGHTLIITPEGQLVLTPLQVFKNDKGFLPTDSLVHLPDHVPPGTDAQINDLYVSVTHNDGKRVRFERYLRTNRDLKWLRLEGLYPDEMLEIAALKDKAVVDIGTGGGQFVHELRAAGAKAVGIDIVLDSQQSAEPSLFIKGEAKKLPLPDKSADVLYSTFGPLSYPQPAVTIRQLLLEMKRVTKVGGAIRISPVDSLVRETALKIPGLGIRLQSLLPGATDSATPWALELERTE